MIQHNIRNNLDSLMIHWNLFIITYLEALYKYFVYISRSILFTLIINTYERDIIGSGQRKPLT